MTVLIELKDNLPNQFITGCPKALLCMQASEKLAEEIKDKRVNFISLSDRRTSYDREISEIISYKIIKTNNCYKKQVIEKICVNVSNFIGCYTTKIDEEIVKIDITPRWGEKIISYLLQYTTGIYIPPESLQGNKEEKNSSEWLLVFLWKSAFHQALRRAHIPKEYRAIKTNNSVFKGRLDVARQIKENITNQTKFCCIDSPQTRDIIINRTIRYAIKLLRRNQPKLLGTDINGYDERLSSFGVKDCIVNVREIDGIRYTKMSESYRRLMQISKSLIKHYGASSDKNTSDQPSFFIDISEIWENYLFAIIKKYLKGYEVMNPNETGGYYLFPDGGRSIRPDLIIKKDNNIIAIIDAKYKKYKEIGKTAQHEGAVSRDDLYQMITYLYHFGGSEKTIGLFITPSSDENKFKLQQFQKHENHFIGVLGFDLDKYDIDSINKEEIGFIKKLEQTLQAHSNDAIPFVIS